MTPADGNQDNRGADRADAWMGFFANDRSAPSIRPNLISGSDRAASIYSVPSDRVERGARFLEKSSDADLLREMIGFSWKQCRRYLVRTTSKQRTAERAFLYAASVTLLAYGSFVLHDFRNRL